MADKSKWHQGEACRFITREFDVTGEMVNEEVKKTTVFAVSRFGAVVVEDVAFNEAGDGRWLGQHTKGKKRTIVHEILKGHK